MNKKVFLIFINQDIDMIVLYCKSFNTTLATYLTCYYVEMRIFSYENIV